ncbi:MAG: hypothetical protein CO189_06920 [candidate division Zixibacteria bacterium CG_4_9_14_3_um_filter_46_8]|nr:MAG: hypothetical protein CO189_06920 [candidate division Zixibacteria bacterium CG_4_9_14_3_um_filter_46_8]
MTKFERQKNQIKLLNSRHKKYWQKEFGGRNTDYISSPENFTERTYFHQANSSDDKSDIVKFGFKEDFVADENKGRGLGAGLYIGRDRAALINFYSVDFNNPADNSIAIRGNFKFFDAISNRLPKRNVKNFVLKNGYDGIRYYDKDATGEEFVLYNYGKIEILI